MSLGNPLDPCITDYEEYIKKEFAVVEDLFTPAFEVEETKLWCKEEEDEDHLTVPELDELMDTSESSPDVIIPDLFQDLADLNSSDFFEELTGGSKESLSDVESFLGPCPTLDEEDGLRSDIMWSSACLNEEIPITSSSSSSKRPRRDSTLSLMECAQNLFRDFELSGFPLMDTPLPSSEDDDEEEIDVVSFEQQWNHLNPHSHSHHHHHHSHSVHHKHHHHHHHHAKPNSNSTGSRLSTVRTNPGRSLLKSQQPPAPPVVMDHGFGDHSYHSVVQPNAAPAPMGILTPTESEDDEETTLNKSKNPPTIVKAVQSLIKAKPTSSSSSSSTSNPSNSSSKDNVKFKFRMKFKSNCNSVSSNNTSSSPSSSSSSSSENSLLRTSCKRKSASNNTYCPPPPSTPTKSSASRNLNESFSKSSSSIKTSSSSSSKRSSHGGGGHSSCSSSSSSGSSNNSSSSSNNSRHSISEAKCREVRDLHNSMERQRRVDLRNNFDQLKVVVPELKDAEKASKLNILNKSAEYCKYLTSTDIRLRKDKEQLMNRNAALTQRLSQLRNVVDRRYQQHRLSEKKRSMTTTTTTVNNNNSNNNNNTTTNNNHSQPIRTLG